MTALSKVSSFMAPLLDPDSVMNENQIKALHQFDPSQDESNKIRSHNEAGFEHVFKLELPERPKIPSGDPPLNREILSRYLAADGRILDHHQLKSLVFRGGIEEDLRKDIWKYMLGYYHWDMSLEDNKKVRD